MTFDVRSGPEALARTLDLTGRKEPPVAMCPRCPDAVLVETFLFNGAEFYCLDCGAHVGYLSPRPQDSTPELVQRCEDAKAEFRALAVDDGGYRNDAAARLAERTLR